MLSTSTPPLTLKSVKDQFENWRANKQGKPKIPEFLWDQVVKLSEYYKIGLLSKTLGISSAQLKSKGLLSNSKKATPSFVEIPVAQTFKNELAPSTLNFQHGEIALSLQNPTPEQITLFINALMR